MRLFWLLVTCLLLLPAVYGLEPPPSGTPFGTFYVRVLDCSSNQTIAGASVSLDNPGHRTSAVTNITGYARIEGYAWFYTYYVTASGCRFGYGERRFTIGEVFTTCLFRETAGFWRVVSDLVRWEGDIHAGGRGWALVRLKNFEQGVFNVTKIELLVAGYERPVWLWELDRGNPAETARRVFQHHGEASSGLARRQVEGGAANQSCLQRR